MQLYRRKFLALLGTASLTFAELAKAQTFEEFKKQQTTGFTDYKTQLEEDFKNYKNIIQEEFTKFKKEAKDKWGDEQIGDNNVFVTYDKAKNTRTIIDYKNGTMTVEYLGKNKDQALTEIKESLIQNSTASVEQAYKNDPLLQNLEKETDKNLSGLTKAPLPKDLLVGDLLTNKPKPSAKEINQALTNKIATQATTSTRAAPQEGMQIFSLSIPIAQASKSPKAEEFKPLVKKYSTTEKIDPALVLAIMHSESSFNPLAKSHIPAFGLMQIVPQSAGRDASEKVYGQQRLLSSSYLYNKENNIKMGSAYMNILYYRYLAKIENPESRTYCMICAYNTGAGNVARAFIGNNNINQAANKINSMTPKQVHQHLLNNLPHAETKNYLKVVVPRYESYKGTV